MQMRCGEAYSGLREVFTMLLWVVLLLSLSSPLLWTPSAAASTTTCITDREDGTSLHFLCFCEPPAHSHVNLKTFQLEFFSLADFAYNLPGTYFAKNVFIRFQVRGVIAEHVFHLQLDRFQIEEHDEGSDDYLSFPAEDLIVSSRNVAMVKVQRGAEFANLVSFSNATELYIDLNGARGDEPVNVHGFMPEHVYFITNTREVPLKKGENLVVKMKHLTDEMQDKSHLISLALSLSTIVILLGIFGLVVVANHRQKRKRQLKAILRAKNLGPVLESRNIAREVGKNFFHKYTSPDEQEDKSKLSSKLPMNTADIEDGHRLPGLHMPRFGGSRAAAAASRKLMDVNDFLSSIMYRIRRNEYTPEHGRDSSTGTSSIAVAKVTTKPKKAIPETSFYYKESSLTSTDGSVRYDPRSGRGEVKSSPSRSESESEGSGESSQADSYVSKISQKVFVHDVSSPSPPVPPPPPPMKARAQVHNGVPKRPFQGELKDKCMTFFSSVTRSKRELEMGWHDNPTYAHSSNSKTKL